MQEQLKGQIALVTGASRGVGKGIALGLGEAGATVYITGRSLNTSVADTEVPSSLASTQGEVEAKGGVCIPIQVDHSDDEQVRGVFDRIQREQDGRLDLLVNNAYAGVKALKDTVGQPFWEHGPGLWDACNNVGLRSHYVASMYAAQMMTPRKQGLICTISSWGSLSYIFGVAYGTGKSACDRLAADMAVELKPYNVTSLSLWPGIVGTEYFNQFAAEMAASDSPDRSTAAISDGYNWETPLLTGRVIAALAADPKVHQRTGRVQIVAELAQGYGLVDREGNRPASLRSLRFLLPQVWPQLRRAPWLVPDIRVPWGLLLLWALRSPKR